VTTTGYTVIDAQPSERFPVYTRGNAGEVYPNVMTPLTGSLIGDASTDGQLRAMREFGMLLERDLRGSGEFGTGVFGGYLYGNLSLLRVVADRAPGLSALDADRQVAGLSDEAPPHRRQRGDRSPVATLRISWTMGRRLLRPDISEVNAARAATDRWRSSIPDPADESDEDLIGFVHAHPTRFADGMRLLLLYSGFAGAGGAMMEQFAERVGAAPGTAAALTAGLGTIDSASPALRLWELSRLVAASPTLTRVFDDGEDFIDGHEHGPETDEFARRFAAFLAAHGARGPDEWELASPTWGTNPEIALAAVERMRHAPATRDPVAAGQRLALERERITRDVRERLPRPLRHLFDRLSRAAGLYAEGRERAKAVFIDDNYPLRAALFELAERTRQRGGPEDRRDFFLVTSDELADFVSDPAAFASLIDERRQQRDFLQERQPPFVFERTLPDPATWPLRSSPVPATLVTPGTATTLTGQGVCAGTARGTARIVRNPAHPRQLEPGDILVAPITDPAWTPLFLAVAGVVVEVGAQQSHAAIVARELGIPAIVGVAGATSRLSDGQLIEIDGATGRITVL
jgi:pyruvate,water dikinase